jgi:iron(III) transport system substrate-binding protein
MKALYLSAALLAVSFADPASAMSIEEIANYAKPDRQKVLEDLARKEGEVLWIGGLNEQTASGPIVKAFNEKYPLIKGRYIRTGTPEGLQRILAEYRAKTPRVDLFNGSAVVDLKQVNLVQAFATPALDVFPAEIKDPERLYATLRLSYQGVAMWDTKQVPADKAPKSYEDLLDPFFKGKIAMSDSQGAGTPFLITYFRKVWGEEKALSYVEKLAKQNPIISSAATRNLADLVVAGEYAILMNPANQHIGQALGKGAPINGVLADPTLARNDYVMMLKTAPHPAASMLLIDHILSQQSAEILQKAEYSPAHPAVEPEGYMKEFTPGSKGYKTFVVDDATLQEMGKSSNDIFKRLFQ